MTKIGVVCFENIENADKAWISISGKPARRISGIGELESSVYWITNLPYFSFLKLNLNKKPNIFDQQFFRTSIKLIAAEVGLEDDLKKLAEFCSDSFQKVFDLTNNIYDIELKYSPYRLNNLLSDYVISRSVKQHPMGSSANTLLDAFRESTQQNQSMLGEAPTGSHTRTFMFPRGAYSRFILSQSYPCSTQWSEIKKKDISTTIGTRESNEIVGTKSAVNKILKICENKSGLFKVNVLYIDKFFRTFANFSQGSNYQRNWVCLPELLEIIKYSTVEILEGYISESEPLKINKKINLKLNEFSFSNGLFLENVWTAYTLPLNRGKFFTPVGAYMRSYDRMVCMKAAYEFARNNLTVGSFGTGRIVVYLRKQDEDLACEVAMENGLMPPLYMLGEK